LAANIFGLPSINFGLLFENLSNDLLSILYGLYTGSINPRIKKSTDRKTITNLFDVMKNDKTVIAVKIELILTTFSSTNLYDIGHVSPKIRPHFFFNYIKLRFNKTFAQIIIWQTQNTKNNTKRFIFKQYIIIKLLGF